MNDSKWLPWITQNANWHREWGPVHAGYGFALDGIHLREQFGYGIIDVAAHAREPKNSGGKTDQFPWMTRNEDHDWESGLVVAPEGSVLVGLDVREQGGYGIVNARCVFRSLNDWRIDEGDWILKNQNGEIRQSRCDDHGKQAITGIEIREQFGYGVIDLRLNCTSLDRILAKLMTV